MISLEGINFKIKGSVTQVANFQKIILYPCVQALQFHLCILENKSIVFLSDVDFF